jgi:hypothetical protein
MWYNQWHWLYLIFYVFSSPWLTTYRSFATTVSQLKISDFSGETFKVLKCYTFLWVQRRHNCSPAASFPNCVVTLCLLKVRLQTFLSIPINQFVANERYAVYLWITRSVEISIVCEEDIFTGLEVLLQKLAAGARESQEKPQTAYLTSALMCQIVIPQTKVSYFTCSGPSFISWSCTGSVS